LLAQKGHDDRGGNIPNLGIMIPEMGTDTPTAGLSNVLFSKVQHNERNLAEL
jgi:hypothetical protein